jgi:23S rRNA U2552 (ribose-2'-O)-methylase RlmE/FtsJ
MFKKSPKNCFKPVLHHTNGSTSSATGATILENEKHANGGPFLSYYNHFLLPQVAIVQSVDDGEYVPLPLHINHEPASASASASSSDEDVSTHNQNDRVYVSSSVYSHLCDIKEQIEKYQDAWDNIKKFTNPYEYIHTNISGNKTNISKLRPLSRSFYKMIEIIKNNNILSPYAHTVGSKPDNKMAITTFHLAEGPGGFIEAISYLRGLEYLRVLKEDAGGVHSSTDSSITSTGMTPPIQILKRNTELHDEVMKDLDQLKLSRRIFETQKAFQDNGSIGGRQITYGNDRYYGMTLINDDPICPGWKKTRVFLENHPNISIETGSDKTGNLISYDNFIHCARKYQNKMEIITADGGFDFSVDFNNQETMATQLILCEVFYALAMQKQGGTFILKIFDVFHKATVDILYLLCYYYNNVSITKPHTSRIANSEKYIVCQGFKISNSAKIIEQVSGLFSSLCSNERISSILPEDHDLYFLNKIEEMNAMVSFQQIENITSTLSIITNHRTVEKLDQYKKINVNKCIAWCDYYEIPYDIHHATIQSTNIFLHRTTTNTQSALSLAAGATGSQGVTAASVSVSVSVSVSLTAP